MTAPAGRPDSRVDAVVVGAGPNGLAAAVVLASAGLGVQVYEASATVGGGARTEELTLPGFRHDVCSGIHPFGAASPLFRSLPLDRHGLEWVHPDLPVAHPLDGGSAAALTRSATATGEGLGDEAAWRRFVQPFVDRWDDLATGFLGPALRVPSNPLLMARFGVRGLRPATVLARRLPEPAAALLSGMAAHVPTPPDRALTGAVGVVFAASAHAVGWPAARAGSQSIADALAGHLHQLGGEVVTGHRVVSVAELPAAGAVLFDTSPAAMADIAGDRLPPRFAARLRGHRRGPGVFKVDYALTEPVPWSADACRRAGTVHVGGTLDEVAEAERAVQAGRVPERPFVLVAQQSLFDATRAPAGRQTLWAYCHVPAGCPIDVTAAIEAQIERFAPGFVDVVLERHVLGPADLEARNPNIVAGDITGGAFGLAQMLLGPTRRRVPYSTPDPGLYLCSSSTPPGPGVHGMCGYHAARAALRRVFGIRRAT